MLSTLKGAMVGAISIGLIATAPAYAGISTPKTLNSTISSLENDTSFSRKRDQKRRYARDQRVNKNTRVWRGNDGRYRCKKDNGTTGLLIGGAVGGLAGNQIAGSGDKLLGTVIGAGAGALLGRELDRDKYRCR